MDPTLVQSSTKAWRHGPHCGNGQKITYQKSSSTRCQSTQCPNTSGGIPAQTTRSTSPSTHYLCNGQKSLTNGLVRVLTNGLIKKKLCSNNKFNHKSVFRYNAVVFHWRAKVTPLMTPSKIQPSNLKRGNTFSLTKLKNCSLLVNQSSGFYSQSNFSNRSYQKEH